MGLTWLLIKLLQHVTYILKTIYNQPINQQHTIRISNRYNNLESSFWSQSRRCRFLTHGDRHFLSCTVWWRNQCQSSRRLHFQHRLFAYTCTCFRWTEVDALSRRPRQDQWRHQKKSRDQPSQTVAGISNRSDEVVKAAGLFSSFQTGNTQCISRYGSRSLAPGTTSLGAIPRSRWRPLGTLHQEYITTLSQTQTNYSEDQRNYNEAQSELANQC